MDLSIPLLGRDVPCGPEGNRVRFLGNAIWGATFGDLNVPPDTWTERDVRWRGSGCGLWRLTTYGVTVMGPPGEDLVVLSDAQILGNAPLPNVNTFVRHRRCLPIWVHLQIGPYGNDYYVDPGGTIEFWADGVDVAWVAPPLWIDCDKQPIIPANHLSGHVYNGLLFAELRRVEAAIGPKRKNLTQHFFVPLNTSQTTSEAGHIRVPRGAKSVSISRDAGGAIVTGSWSMMMKPNFTAAVPNLLGVIQIINRSCFVAVPLAGNVTHLAAPNIGEDATWTLVWEIEP